MGNAPTIKGVIRRRLLVNFRVDPEVIQPLLPPPFRPKLMNGAAIAGICLIRLEQMRPKALPLPFGIASENAAHRIAVCWNDEQGQPREGVFVPRRDSDSLANHIAGGRIFPGEYHMASFRVRHGPGKIAIRMESHDGKTVVDVQGNRAPSLPSGSAFSSLAEASAFFEHGCDGYSATQGGEALDGMCLRTARWEVQPLQVDHVYSSYFTDTALFPAGSATFDCALVMENVDHEWVALPKLSTTPGK